MMSTVWFQTALRFGETDSLITRIMIAICVLLVFVVIKGDEDIGIAFLYDAFITGLFYIFALSLIWNKPQYKCKNAVKKPKKTTTKKKKESTVPVETTKKKQNKKNKRQKKTTSKENRDPPTVPVMEQTKVYKSLDSCKRFNMSKLAIYQHLRQFAMSEQQLILNNYPLEHSYFPPNEVAVNYSNRQCVRCGSEFEIYNGLYLSSTTCNYHPRKALYQAIYPCCDGLIGAMPCAKAEKHVTLQHGPKPLVSTSRRRHVKKDLQFRIFALDCEMSYTTAGLEVTRIGVVDLDGCTYYESFVKPLNEVLDYNTQYSGVSKEDLLNVETTLEDVKRILSSFIYEDTILIGHALNNDLAALGLIHRTVIDTSVLYPDPKRPGRKRSLKALAAELLNKSIQEGKEGHNCIDDARACLELAFLQIPLSPPQESRPLVEVQNLNFGYMPYCGNLPPYMRFPPPHPHVFRPMCI